MAQSAATYAMDMLDLVHESIFARDLDLRITFWNAASEALYGWTREEAIGANAADLLQCIHILPLAERESQLLETGRWEGEFTRLTKSGSEVLIDARWSLRRDSAGNVAEVVETGRDITDRRKTEEAMLRSELKYRNLFNYMPIALWQLDAQRMGEIFDNLVAAGVTDLRQYMSEHPDIFEEALASIAVTELNDRTIALFEGTDRESLIRKMPSLWLDQDAFFKSTEAQLAGEMSYTNEAAIQTLSGRRVDILYSAAFSDPSNTASSTLVGAVDISASKRAAAELAQKELKYRNLFRYMPMSLWQIDISELVPVLGALRSDGITDLDRHLRDFPDVLDRLLGLLHVDQVNDRTVKLFGGSDARDFEGPISRFWGRNKDTLRRSLVAHFNGDESYSEETRVSAIDGRTVDVVFASAFPQALGDMGICLVGTVDIGDRLQAEQMLQKVQADFAHAARIATLGELTASIAHEVKQPLTAIATYGEASLRWLEHSVPNLEEVRILARRTVADAQRASDVIARIRSMASRHPTLYDAVSVGEAVHEMMLFLQREFQTNQVAVNFDSCSNLPPVRADRTQLQQLLVNLAVNAVQAMAHQPTETRQLTIRSKPTPAGKVTIEFEDSGPGVTATDKHRVFDSFFTTKKSGLGIGLSICRSIIEDHGGEIELQNLESGACFRFTMPIAQ